MGRVPLQFVHLVGLLDFAAAVPVAAVVFAAVVVVVPVVAVVPVVCFAVTVVVVLIVVPAAHVVVAFSDLTALVVVFGCLFVRVHGKYVVVTGRKLRHCAKICVVPKMDAVGTRSGIANCDGVVVTLTQG